VNYIKTFIKALNVIITEMQHGVILLVICPWKYAQGKKSCVNLCVYMYLLMDTLESSWNVNSRSL